MTMVIMRRILWLVVDANELARWVQLQGSERGSGAGAACCGPTGQLDQLPFSQPAA